MFFGPPSSGMSSAAGGVWGRLATPRTYIRNEFTGGWELDEASGGAPKPEVDYSYYFSPAHRALRAAEARKIGERAGEPIIPPGFEGFVKSDLFDISRLPKYPTYEESMAVYDAERADLPPVSGPFPTIRNEFFRIQPGVYDWEKREYGGQLQYLDPVLPSMLNLSRGSWKKVDDSPAIRRLASTPNLYASFYPRGGRGAEYTYWKRAIQEAVANPNKGPGPQQRSLGIGGRVYAQSRALLERPSSKGIFGLPGPVSGILQGALLGAGAGYIGSTVAAAAAAGLPQTALTAATAANVATSIPDVTNPNTNIGPLATFASAFLPGGKFIAPVVGAGTGYVSGGPTGALFGGLRGLGAAYTAGELAAPSPTPPSLFIPSTQGVYSGLGSLGTAANVLGSPGGQFLTTIGQSLATPTPTPQTIGALAPAGLTAALTAGAALTPSNVPYTYEPSYIGKALGPNFLNQIERGIASLGPGTAAPSPRIRSLDPNFMNQFERAKLGLA